MRRFRRDDGIFKIITLASAITVLVLLAGVMIALLHGSLPAWRAFGFGFFTSESWNPVTEKFGALPAIGAMSLSDGRSRPVNSASRLAPWRTIQSRPLRPTPMTKPSPHDPGLRR